MDFRVFRIAMVLGGVFAGTASAADIDTGVSAWEAGDYATAFSVWQPLAESGDREAQHFLGFMYLKGKGVERDDARAAYWYKAAAEQGVVEAQVELGLMYEVGQGVPADPERAGHWYDEANMAGDFCPRELPRGGRLGD